MKSYASVAAMSPSRARDPTYEKHIFEDTKCEVRWGTTGRTLMALEPIAKGSVLWKVSPASL